MIARGGEKDWAYLTIDECKGINEKQSEDLDNIERSIHKFNWERDEARLNGRTPNYFLKSTRFSV